MNWCEVRKSKLIISYGRIAWYKARQQSVLMDAKEQLHASVQKQLKCTDALTLEVNTASTSIFPIGTTRVD
jgi:hypothetical protein